MKMYDTLSYRSNAPCLVTVPIAMFMIKRVLLDQSVILKDPITLILYFHAEEHHSRFYDPLPGGSSV